jgi:hypothetical protein
MSAINGITQEPMAKVAQALGEIKTTTDDHERRIGDLEKAREKDMEAREQDNRSRRSLTITLIFQSLLFIANLVAALAMRG